MPSSVGNCEELEEDDEESYQKAIISLSCPWYPSSGRKLSRLDDRTRRLTKKKD